MPFNIDRANSLINSSRAIDERQNHGFPPHTFQENAATAVPEMPTDTV